MSLVWALVALNLGHGVASPKTVLLEAGGPFVALVVTYVVTPEARANQLRALADRNKDAVVDEGEASALEALMVEEATLGMALEIDGVGHALKRLSVASVGLEGDTRRRRRLETAVLMRTATPVFCGFHLLGRTETIMRGAAPPPARIIWLCAGRQAGAQPI